MVFWRFQKAIIPSSVLFISYEMVVVLNFSSLVVFQLQIVLKEHISASYISIRQFRSILGRHKLTILKQFLHPFQFAIQKNIFLKCHKKWPKMTHKPETSQCTLFFIGHNIHISRFNHFTLFQTKIIFSNLVLIPYVPYA